jgi:hypothetical protein
MNSNRNRASKPNYDLLINIRASDVINTAILFVSLTIIMCYIAAAAKGDTIYDVPIVSDTFTKDPQTWISRFFINVAAVFLFGFAFIQEAFVRAFFDTDTKTWERFAKRTRLVGAIAAVGLAGVASVQKNENVYIHGFCAFQFLCGALLWVCMLTYQMYKNFEPASECTPEEEGEEASGGVHFLQSKAYRKKHLWVKSIACAIGAFSMFMFVVVRMPPKGGFDRNYRILASFEWIAVVSILTAVWSVGQDYGAGMRISVTWKINAKTRKEMKALAGTNNTNNSSKSIDDDDSRSRSSAAV